MLIVRSQVMELNHVYIYKFSTEFGDKLLALDEEQHNEHLRFPVERLFTYLGKFVKTPNIPSKRKVRIKQVAGLLKETGEFDSFLYTAYQVGNPKLSTGYQLDVQSTIKEAEKLGFME